MGLWRSTGKGTVEFKKDGSFVILDNMGAIVEGTYARSDGDISLQITDTNIMRKKMEPLTTPEVLSAKMVIDGDQLSLTHISGNTEEVENYTRIT